MSRYALHGKLMAAEGQVDELAEILIEASKLVSSAKGCHLYLISKDPSNPNAVWITEVWDSKEDHDNSLKVAGVMDLISKAMPPLAEKPQKGQELEIIGGTGIKE